VRHVSHVSIARDYYLSSIRRKSFKPRYVIVGVIVGITGEWCVISRTFNLKVSGDLSELPLIGKSLESSHHRGRNIFVKRNFQAAIRKCRSNLTASFTCFSDKSKMPATNLALPSTFTALATVAVGI